MRYQNMQSKLREDRHDEAVCKETWRKSKYDTAQRLSALQLEHNAHTAINKEEARLLALKEREARYNDKSEIRRQAYSRRATSVATTLAEQQRSRNEMEMNRGMKDEERQNAYMASVNRHQKNLAMRGKQKQMEILRKVAKVRDLEDEKVSIYMKASEDKMSQFLHQQLEKERHDEHVQQVRRASNAKNEERRQQMMAQQEERRQELLQRLSNTEEMNRRAAEKKQDEDILRAEKHELRQHEIAKSQQRLHRMEEYRLKSLHDKVQREDERIKGMQDEKHREMELVRRIKQDSFVKQKAIQEKANKHHRLRKHHLLESLDRRDESHDAVLSDFGGAMPLAQLHEQ